MDSSMQFNVTVLCIHHHGSSRTAWNTGYYSAFSDSLHNPQCKPRFTFAFFTREDCQTTGSYYTISYPIDRFRVTIKGDISKQLVLPVESILLSLSLGFSLDCFLPPLHKLPRTYLPTNCLQSIQCLQYP